MRALKIAFTLLLLSLAACAPPPSPPDAAQDTQTPLASPTTPGPQEGFQGTPFDTATPPQSTSTGLPLNCLKQVTPGDQLFVNISDANIGAGYCFRYPKSFYISYTPNVGRGIHGPSSSPGENLFGGAVVQPLGPTLTNSLDDLADSLHPQATIREETLIGDVAALLLYGFPEDADRRVALVIHDGLLFEFNNSEINAPGEGALTQAQLAWDNLLASFAFLPPGFAEPYADCPIGQAKPDVEYTAWYLPYVNVEEGYCLLVPQDHVLHYDADRRWLLIQKPDPGFNHDPGAVTLSIMGDQPSGGLELRSLVNEVIETQARGEVYRIGTFIAGQDGIFVDGLYSEAGLRHIFFLYNDIFYKIVGSPTLVEERLADMEELFDIATESLTFIP